MGSVHLEPQSRSDDWTRRPGGQRNGVGGVRGKEVEPQPGASGRGYWGAEDYVFNSLTEQKRPLDR